MAISDYSRTIPQRLRTTFAPPPLDARFDDVLARLTRSLEGAPPARTQRTAAPVATADGAPAVTNDASRIA